jgi:hypothetical protein
VRGALARLKLRLDGFVDLVVAHEPVNTLDRAPVLEISTDVGEPSRPPILLRSLGTEFKVMQEWVRHSSLSSTLDIYTQAVTPAKHVAQAAVLSLVFSPEAGGAPRSEAQRAVAGWRNSRRDKRRRSVIQSALERTTTDLGNYINRMLD